jgi:hypothetical protein
MMWKMRNYEDCNVGGHHNTDVSVDTDAYAISTVVITVCSVLLTILRVAYHGKRTTVLYYARLVASILAGLALYLVVFAASTTTCHPRLTTLEEQAKLYDLFGCRDIGCMGPMYSLVSPTIMIASIGLALPWTTGGVKHAICKSPSVTWGYQLGLAADATCRAVGMLTWAAGVSSQIDWGKDLPHRHEHLLHMQNFPSIAYNNWYIAVAYVGGVLAIFDLILGLMGDRAIKLHETARPASLIFGGAYLMGISYANGLLYFPISHHNYPLVWGVGIYAMGLAIDCAYCLHAAF